MFRLLCVACKQQYTQYPCTHNIWPYVPYVQGPAEGGHLDPRTYMSVCQLVMLFVAMGQEHFTLTTSLN